MGKSSLARLMIGTPERSRLPGSGLEILFLQSADMEKYRPMLDVTSQTVKEYCRRNRLCYQSYYGIIRGSRQWQASYNRIPLLKMIGDSGYRGWVCYLDADAYIHDLTFDLRSYLNGKQDYGLIAAPSGITPPVYWEINNGVLLVNFGHQVGRQIVSLWHDQFIGIDDEQFECKDDWDKSYNDQLMLQNVLKENAAFSRSILIDGYIINTPDANFIRQVLRATISDFDLRFETIVKATLESLMRGGITAVDSTLFEKTDHLMGRNFLETLYRTLLLRTADRAGLEDHFDQFLQQGDMDHRVRAIIGSEEFKGNFEAFCEEYGLPKRG